MWMLLNRGLLKESREVDAETFVHLAMGMTV